MFQIYTSTQDAPLIRYSDRVPCPDCGLCCMRTESERRTPKGTRYRYSLRCERCGYSDGEEWA